jgi:hypothetical protein
MGNLGLDAFALGEGGMTMLNEHLFMDIIVLAVGEMSTRFLLQGDGVKVVLCGNCCFVVIVTLYPNAPTFNIWRVVGN